VAVALEIRAGCREVAVSEAAALFIDLEEN
jgi:hypothetical protein